MAALSERQLAVYLKQAGFPDERIPLMINIAKRESGLNPTAHNPNAETGDNSYGLFQINMIGNLGPARLKEFADIGVNSYEDLKDPWKNVQAAKRVLDSQGINAWTTARAAAQDPTPAMTGEVLTGEGGSSPLSEMMGSLLRESLGEATASGQAKGRMAGSAPVLAELEAVNPAVAAQVGVVTSLLPQVRGGARTIGIDGGPTPAGVLPTGEGIGITELGRKLQGLGLKVAEHPEFGGVGKHSPGSHHYDGNALDLTIQPGSPLLAGRPDSDWRTLTKEIGARLKAGIPGAEIFHPGSDPVGGHDSHIHLALPAGRAELTSELAKLLG